MSGKLQQEQQSSSGKQHIQARVENKKEEELEVNEKQSGHIHYLIIIGMLPETL